jgi:glutamate racemase
LIAKLTKKVTEDRLYMRTTKRIGLFDSGVGGLSVLRHLVTVTEGEGLEFVYLGDAARCPYGNRAKAEIATFVDEIVSWLTSFQLDAIVMACNTSAAVAKDAAVAAASRAPAVKLYDLIEPTADWIVANPPNSVGVMSTINTANSKAFSKALAARGYQGSVVELGCPKLVPLIESGRLGESECESALSLALTEYLQALAGVDALILGCTHFPFVADRIENLVQGQLKALFPNGLKLIDPAHALAFQLLGLAAPNLIPQQNEAPLAAEPQANCYQSDAFRFFTTGIASDFAVAAERCLGQPLGQVQELAVSVLERAASNESATSQQSSKSLESIKLQNVAIDVATSGSFA